MANQKAYQKRYPDLLFKNVSESSIATELKEMAIEGLGVAWIQNTIISDDLANGRLVRVSKKRMLLWWISKYTGV